MSSIKDIYYYYLEELNRALGITLESVRAHIKVYMSIKNRDASTAVEVLNEAMSGNIIAIEKSNLQRHQGQNNRWLQAQVVEQFNISESEIVAINYLVT